MKFRFDEAKPIVAFSFYCHKYFLSDTFIKVIAISSSIENASFSKLNFIVIGLKPISKI